MILYLHSKWMGLKGTSLPLPPVLLTIIKTCSWIQ